MYDGVVSERQVRHEADGAADHYAREANQRIRDTCVELFGQAKAQCISEARNTSRESQRNERDLEAQQVVAVWTSVIGRMTVVGVILSAVGIALVYGTFQQTREAAVAAQRKLEAIVLAEGANLQVDAMPQVVDRGASMYAVIGMESVGGSAPKFLQIGYEIVDSISKISFDKISMLRGGIQRHGRGSLDIIPDEKWRDKDFIVFGKVEYISNTEVGWRVTYFASVMEAKLPGSKERESAHKKDIPLTHVRVRQLHPPEIPANT